MVKGAIVAAALLLAVLGIAQAEPGSWQLQDGDQQGNSQSQPAPTSEDAAAQATATPLSQSHGTEGDKEVEQSESKVRYLANTVLAWLLHSIDFVDEHEGFFLVAFTALLAVFTYMLRRSTDRLWLAGEEQMALVESNAVQQSTDMKASTKAAADAATAAIRSAEIAERTLLDVERPHLFVENVMPVVPVKMEWADLPEHKIPVFELDYDIINYGRTPAIVLEIKAGILLGVLPTVPRWHPGEMRESEWVIATHGKGRTGNAFIRQKVTHAMLGEMWLSEIHVPGREPQHIWFYGAINYRSVNGIADEIGFIYRYLPHGPGFTLENIPGYTYRSRGEAKTSA